MTNACWVFINENIEFDDRQFRTKHLETIVLAPKVHCYELELTIGNLGKAEKFLVQCSIYSTVSPGKKRLHSEAQNAEVKDLWKDTWKENSISSVMSRLFKWIWPGSFSRFQVGWFILDEHNLLTSWKSKYPRFFPCFHQCNRCNVFVQFTLFPNSQWQPVQFYTDSFWLMAKKL